MSFSKKKVLLALSGGIDSSYSLYLLKKQGFDVEALFLQTNDLLDDNLWRRVQAIADYFQIKVYKLDIRKKFRKVVIEKFINDYLSGITPSPCVYCNPEIKFKSLEEFADKLGIYYIATGHYIRKRKYKGNYYLYRSLDPKKDQTYFLYRLTKKTVQRLLFPLSNYKKEFIKEEIKKVFKSDLISKSESQELCFVPDKGLEEFFKKELKKIKTGKIIDIDNGKILGKHKGIMFYTIGQRKALGLAGGPWFVVALDAKKNIVYVCHEKKKEKYLYTKILYLDDIYWQIKKEKLPAQLLAKHRSNQSLRKVYLTYENGKYKVEFAEAQLAITPGQSIVFYKNNRLLGGAEIPQFLKF